MTGIGLQYASRKRLALKVEKYIPSPAMELWHSVAVGRFLTFWFSRDPYAARQLPDPEAVFSDKADKSRTCGGFRIPAHAEQLNSLEGRCPKTLRE